MLECELMEKLDKNPEIVCLFNHRYHPLFGEYFDFFPDEICKITGPSECGKTVFLTNLILNIINEHEKIYINSPSLHQHLY